MTKPDLVSATKRGWLLIASGVSVVLVFWSAAMNEQVSYLLPLFIAACLVISNGFVFIASRLQRSDVTAAERRLRHILFEKI